MALKKKYSIEKFWESTYPFIWAAIFTCTAYFLHFELWLDFDSLLSSIQVTSSIFVGFLGTAIGIIFTSNSERTQWLKAKGELWKKTIEYFRISFSLNLLLCVSSFIFKSVQFTDFSEIRSVAFLATGFLCVAAFMAFYRAIKLFFLVII